MESPDDSLSARRRNPYLTVLGAAAVLSLIAAVIFEVYAASASGGAAAVALATVTQFAALIFSGAFLVTGAVFWRRDERRRILESAIAEAEAEMAAEAHRRAEYER